MKLRTRHNSVRFRLTQGEVAQFMADGLVCERIEFSSVPSQSLEYVLRVSDESDQICATFADGRIVVDVPIALARDWSFSAKVGLEATQELAHEKTLKILIEKDWACLKPREGEDESDNFAHPQLRVSPNMST